MNQEAQQPQQEQQIPWDVPMGQAPRDLYPGTILQLTNTEQELYKFEMKLRGVRVDFQGDTLTEKKERDPLVTEDGIHRIMDLVESYVNKIHTLTYYTKKDIKRIMLRFGGALNEVFLECSYLFNVRNDSDKRVIFVSALGLVEGTLSRSLEGGERGFWRNSQHHISMQTNQEKEPEGWKKFVPGWK